MNFISLKKVLITGASTGIGHSSVAQMVKSGWHVFAGVRKSQDGDKLKSEFGSSVTPVLMDVTDRGSITAAVDTMSSHFSGQGLDGLVNVAGIGMIRPVEYASPADLQTIFDINLFGQIAIIQAFLPLLRKSEGRIVNISSVGAHFAIPFGGLLNASKAAFGIISDALRLELRPSGVRVSIIEPGAIATPAVGKTLGNIEEVVGNLPPAGKREYGEVMTGFAKRGYEREMSGSSPDVVAQAVYHALTADRPRIRYRVGKHARLLTTLPKVLPDRILDELLLRIAGIPTRPVTVQRARKHRPFKPAFNKP